MKSNKNGVKLLAAIAVFAMVAAALVVALPASDAEIVDPEPSIVGKAVIIDASGTAGVEQDFSTAIASATAGQTIKLTSDVTTNLALTFNDGVTLNGNGFTIKAVESSVFTGEWISNAQGKIYVLNITNKIAVQNLTVDSDKLAFGVNVSTAKDTEVKLENVSSNNSVGAGFVFGHAKVTATNLVAKNFSWPAGINYSDATIEIDTLVNVGGIYADASDIAISPKVGDASTANYVTFYKDLTKKTVRSILPASEAENINALEYGVCDNSGTWSISSEGLKLENYNGYMYFAGTFETLILIGDNTITLDADECAGVAIYSEGLAEIKTKASGVGALDITVDGENAGSAIVSSTGLIINGVSIGIDIESTDEDVEAFNAIASSAGPFTSLSILFSDISITTNDANDVSSGFVTGTLAVTGSKVTISAPAAGIKATGTTEIADSQIAVEAGKDAFNTAVKANISNESIITLASVSGYAFIGGFELTQGSVITASSMDITVTSDNYASVTNGGKMVIEKEVTFNNYLSFTNNGVIGVYGAFQNGGQTVNNGEVNTYGIDSKGTGIDSLVVKDKDGTTVTFAFTKATPLADGTFAVTVTLKGVGDPAADVSIDGILTYSASKITIKAVDSEYSVTITVTTEDGANVKTYSVTVTSLISVTEKTADTNNNENLDALKSILSDFVTTTTGAQSISVNNGTLTNNGSILINKTQSALVAGGELVNAGTITANSGITVTDGKLSGNVISLGDEVKVELTGTIDIAFQYAGDFTRTVDGKETTVTFDNLLQVVGDCNGVVFSTVDGGDDVDARFSITADAAKTNKSVKVTLSKGTAYATGENSVFGTGVTIEVLADATFQAVGTINVGSGVLAAQDGSIINIKGDDFETYSYGTLNYVISFAKDGYTYYGDLSYALANASEGMTLTLNNTATIDKNLTVGKGITLQFAKKAVLEIGKAGAEAPVTIDMQEGASFVFTDATNKVLIINTGAVVSGTFVYDGNVVVLSKVKMAADDLIGCDAAGKSTVSDVKVAVAAAIKDGTITADAGKAIIGVSFGNDTTDKTASKLVISEGATATGIVALSAGASAVIDGSLLIDDANIGAKLSGNGAIVLSDEKSVTFSGKAVQNIKVTNKDATDSIVLSDVAVNKDAGIKTLVVKSVSKSGTQAAYMNLAGEYYSGTVTVNGNAGITAVTVPADAVLVVPEGSVLNVLSASYANGLVKVAGTINMKVDGDSSTTAYGVLSYEITYADGDYTVYTIVTTAVENATAGDSFTLTKDLSVSDKLEVPSGVTIIVPEGKKIIVGNNAYLIVGTGITTLGATGGIQGTVQLKGTAYIVEFADASIDNTNMKIVGSTDDAKIVNSQVNVLNVLYATVYTTQGCNLTFGTVDDTADVASKIVPTIDGYRFVKLTDVVGEKLEGTEKVGETDVVAEMLPTQVQVTFQPVEGLKYYVDGNIQAIVGAPVYVNYGAIITAVADSGYTGTPLVNGKTYITVDNSLKTVVGSGVSPAVDPTPITPVEPTEKDDGMGLTDILLIVLVILAAILVIVVAIRMMRS